MVEVWQKNFIKSYFTEGKETILGCLGEVGQGVQVGGLREVAEANPGGNVGLRWSKAVKWWYGFFL